MVALKKLRAQSGGREVSPSLGAFTVTKSTARRQSSDRSRFFRAIFAIQGDVAEFLTRDESCLFH